MATIHQLALFCRSQQARARTTLHFPLPAKESSHSRAQSIVSALEQLTTLQLYGAAIETTQLKVDLTKILSSKRPGNYLKSNCCLSSVYPFALSLVLPL